MHHYPNETMGQPSINANISTICKPYEYAPNQKSLSAFTSFSINAIFTFRKMRRQKYAREKKNHGETHSPIQVADLDGKQREKKYISEDQNATKKIFKNANRSTSTQKLSQFWHVFLHFFFVVFVFFFSFLLFVFFVFFVFFTFHPFPFFWLHNFFPLLTDGHGGGGGRRRAKIK